MTRTNLSPDPFLLSNYFRKISRLASHQQSIRISQDNFENTLTLANEIFQELCCEISYVAP
jgi:hypothetical protein